MKQSSKFETSQILVSPSILSADFANLQREIESVVASGADLIHVDVMDGHFVPNITMGPAVVAKIKPICGKPLDVHLMIENPETYIESFLKAGSDIITIHVESTKNVTGTLKKIRDGGAKCGITLRPATAIEEILPYLPSVDLVLIMTVDPGFSGQSFMQNQVGKIERVKKEALRLGLSPLIEVDGGINKETARICRLAGANVFVAGNFIFKGNYKEAIAALKE